MEEWRVLGVGEGRGEEGRRKREDVTLNFDFDFDFELGTLESLEPFKHPPVERRKNKVATQ